MNGYDEKARANLRKHGILFEDALLAFDDPHYIIEQDPEEKEERWQLIGMADNCLLLLVIHTIREKNEMEVTRIISARRATPKERKRYGNRKLS